MFGIASWLLFAKLVGICFPPSRPHVSERRFRPHPCGAHASQILTAPPNSGSSPRNAGRTANRPPGESCASAAVPPSRSTCKPAANPMTKGYHCTRRLRKDFTTCRIGTTHAPPIPPETPPKITHLAGQPFPDVALI